MNILAPFNDPAEVVSLIEAGADELYCGLLPETWRRTYTNMASINRREWSCASLNSYDQLKQAVTLAHDRRIPVFLTLNALYSEDQYPLVLEQIDRAEEIGVDALIVADIGLMLTMQRRPTSLPLHISTGGTIFNVKAVDFYRRFNAVRIVLPRHLAISEISALVGARPEMDFEVFVLNSGCKNIDGFCTFQHGVSEIRHGKLWNIPKRFHLDEAILNGIRRLPQKITRSLGSKHCRMDSACHLNYQVQSTETPEAEHVRRLRKNVEEDFVLLAAVDSCAACEVLRFSKIGLHGLKIVGRNHSTGKKLKDVRFLRSLFDHLDGLVSEDEFRRIASGLFKEIYGFACAELCYYPDDKG